MEYKKNLVKKPEVSLQEDFLFGTRAVIEALKAGKPVDRILLKSGLQNELFGELYQLIKELEIPFQYVPLEKLNRVTRKNHQGVIALISPIEFHRLEDLLPAIYEKGEDPLLLLVDQVTDVRNFGAMVRSAECAGVHAVIIPEKGSARIGGDAVKTSAGALHLVPVCRVRDIVAAVAYLQESGIRVIASTEKAQDLYYNLDLTGPLAIIMGSEDEGISPALLRKADLLAAIPVLGNIASLNVSVAASLMVYEAVRQRGIAQV